MSDINIFNLIKDFGLPLVALWYLFRLYTVEVNKNSIREERCIKVIEDNILSNTQIIVAMQNISAVARTEADIRQALLTKLVDRALADR
jgi:hypothetical protein